MLNQARELANVVYIESDAELLPIKSHTISMVCVAQSLHWFSTIKFYNEVKRVLKSNGIVSAWCYNQTIIEPVIDNILSKFYGKIQSYNEDSSPHQYLYSNYENLPFPFDKIASPLFAQYFHEITEFDML